MQNFLERIRALPQDGGDLDAQATYLSELATALPKLSADDVGIGAAAVGGSPLKPHDKKALVAAIVACAQKKSKRRPYQDWTSCRNFMTYQVWKDGSKNPNLALEALVQHLSKGGLVAPSEPTAAMISALVAGLIGGVYTDSQQKDMFEKVKTRLKALEYKPEMYVEMLPATPAQFLREYPTMARKIFSKDDLPVSCPLTELVVSHQLSLLKMRGNATEPTGPLTIASVRNMISSAFVMMAPRAIDNDNFRINMLGRGGNALEDDRNASRPASRGMMALMDMERRNEHREAACREETF